MKQVSSWAAIIAIPTLVTGYYGMNVPYPGSGESVGVVTATGIMIVACIGLHHLFRRNQWLYRDPGVLAPSEGHVRAPKQGRLEGTSGAFGAGGRRATS